MRVLPDSFWELLVWCSYVFAFHGVNIEVSNYSQSYEAEHCPHVVHNIENRIYVECGIAPEVREDLGDSPSRGDNHIEILFGYSESLKDDQELVSEFLWILLLFDPEVDEIVVVENLSRWVRHFRLYCTVVLDSKVLARAMLFSKYVRRTVATKVATKDQQSNMIV